MAIASMLHSACKLSKAVTMHVLERHDIHFIHKWERNVTMDQCVLRFGTVHCAKGVQIRFVGISKLINSGFKAVFA